MIVHRGGLEEEGKGVPGIKVKIIECDSSAHLLVVDQEILLVDDEFRSLVLVDALLTPTAPPHTASLLPTGQAAPLPPHGQLVGAACHRH